MLALTFDAYEIMLGCFGIVALLAALTPSALRRRPVSLPMLLIVVGVGLFAAIPALRIPNPATDLELTEKATEAGVLVSILAAGLSLDRSIGWRSWRPTWRLLAITMPLTVGIVAVVGSSVLGLSLASAVLLGAVVAPTDPVVADELTVEEPNERGGDSEATVPATLTSEAGLNDALAFPFVYLAIVVFDTPDGGDFVAWLLGDVIGRVAVGLGVGVAVGRAVQWLAFQVPRRRFRLAERSEGFVALALLLLAYALAELAYGYGFLAVFAAAVTFRRAERNHRYHDVLHDFADQLERVAVIVLLLLFGGSLLSGAYSATNVATVAVAVAIVLLVRPLAGFVGLLGEPLKRDDRTVIAGFGVRGIGSIYYLAYALRSREFGDSETLWAVVAAMIVVSVFVHGALVPTARARMSAAPSNQSEP